MKLVQVRATFAASAICSLLVAGPLVTVAASSSQPPRATPARSAAGASSATAAASQPDTNPLSIPAGSDRPVSQVDSLLEALVRLPAAAALGAALAFRPRRRGTPHRTPAVIQTQIVLAVLGSLIMLIVGASLARAFGIVGAAGLIRYRAKIDDPKDAAVMLGTLGVGLATGVGLYLLAAFATLFILVLLLLVESLEEGHQLFELKVKSEDMAGLRGRVESLLSAQPGRARAAVRVRARGVLPREAAAGSAHRPPAGRDHAPRPEEGDRRRVGRGSPTPR